MFVGCGGSKVVKVVRNRVSRRTGKRAGGSSRNRIVWRSKLCYETTALRVLTATVI